MSRTPQINIGLFGFGTVGSHLYRLLDQNREIITRKLGFPIHIKKIGVTDLKKKYPFSPPVSLLTTKPSDILDDPEISIIVELIGDKPVALELIKKAISLGKHVVTANKAILAKHGEELYRLAESCEVDIHFEGAVAGAIPVLRSIREAFVADTILSIKGIINGTSNYILSGMTEKKSSFQEALRGAQEAGYAEADPSADVDGHDAAHKLAILASLAHGQIVPLEKIHCEGIRDITSLDFEMADRFGYTIKLLGIAKKTTEALEVRVHPTMIPKEHVLSSVRGAYNAVMLEGEALGQSLLYGAGAGGFPTASAVLADVVEIARNIALQVPGVPPLGMRMDHVTKASVKSMEDVESEYYLRFQAHDRPGVFGKIAQILGAHQMSIASVYQHGREEGKDVPIVVLIHRAREKNVMNALREIDKLSIVSQKTHLIRIES